MNVATQSLTALRSAFDQTFAAPARGRVEDLVSLLTIDIGNHPFALRTAELSGLVADRRVVPVPSRRPELLGLIGLRGTLVPVFDLARLLGVPRHDPEPRWLALADRENPVAFAFDRLEGYIDVPPACLYAGVTELRQPCVGHLVQAGPVVRGLIELPPLIETIRKESMARGRR
jgi:chemotaxis signal transduction protein